MALARSPVRNPNMDSENIREDAPKCHHCNEIIQCQNQECFILDTCQHTFHRACIEEALANSSQCPLCKNECELSNLKKFPIDNMYTAEMSTQTGTTKKSYSSYRGKGRGAAANRPITRNFSKNLFSDNLNVSNSFEFPPQYSIEMPGDASNQNSQNSNNNAVERIDNNSKEIDYLRINQMIECSISKMLKKTQLKP
ncbi:uncharacterized protein [Musca autumnalis]|uniref:uncharacterized protein n=1 Tax=Musca autumnalis TaxID=221902 RepID=UPI003CE84C71